MSTIITRPNIRATHRLWSKTAFFSSSSSLRSNSAAVDHNQELFEHTFGRWLYNESIRLSERRLVFNVSELKRTAARCLGQPESEVKEFFKFAEGGFNRVFQITMKDGSEVLARLPYPSTKPNRLALASEVATLDLVRAHSVHVPKVLYYSADAENPVGAEFMIMEKLPGRPIGDRWFDLLEDQRLKIILEVVQTEVKLSKSICRHMVVFTTSATSLLKYLAPPWHPCSTTKDFVLAHSSPLQVLSSVAAKELAWLKAFGRPRLPFERAYRESLDYQKSRPEEHIDNLEKFLTIAPYLVPKDARFHRPNLRHPDLQPNNIFVSENLDVVGIIDWQHCSVLPQFLAAGIPEYFQNYHDEESLRFIPPKLPETLAEMDDEEHAEALEKFRRRHLHFFYLGFTQQFNLAHFEALERRMDLLTRKSLNHAGDPWEGNSIPLRADLMQIIQNWQVLMDDNGFGKKAVPLSPISFTEPDVQHTINVLQQQEDIDTQLEKIQNAIGIGADGWTPSEEYDGTVERAKLMKKQDVESLHIEEEKEMTLKHWPFDDFDEEG